MLRVDPTLASVVCLALFISAGLVLYLALTVRSLRARNAELESANKRLKTDFRLLRAVTPFAVACPYSNPNCPTPYTPAGYGDHAECMEVGR